MQLRLQDDFDPGVLHTLFDIMDETFNHTIKPKLIDAKIYVIGNKDEENDDVFKEVIKELEKHDKHDELKFFKDKTFKDNEIVICLDNDNSHIESMIVKVNVDNGNGYKTLSVIHFVNRLIEIFQEKNVIPRMTQGKVLDLIDKIVYGVPERIPNSEVVLMASTKSDFLSYFI